MSDKPSQSRWLFILLLLVAAGSLFAIIILHANQNLQWLVQILSAPFVVALLGIVVQALLWEQRKQHDRLLEQSRQYHKDFLQEREQALQLGAVSGIAQRVFDGYADFCEEYLHELYQINIGMAGDKPGRDWKKYAEKLRDIRLGKKHYAWIPDELDKCLWVLECSLWDVDFYNATAEELDRAGRADSAYNLRLKALEIANRIRGWTSDDGEEAGGTNDLKSVSEIMGELKKILQLEELTQLRRELVKNAISPEGTKREADASSEGAEQE